MTHFARHVVTFAALLTILPRTSLGADPAKSKVGSTDPLAPILSPHLKPTVAVFLNHYHGKRKYVNADFSMSVQKFAAFKNEITTELARTLGVQDWVVRSPAGKASPIGKLFEDRLIKTISLHGVVVELHAVAIQPTGLVVPMAICLPLEESAKPSPGVCAFSGHTAHGLNDLVVNLDSYQ